MITDRSCHYLSCFLRILAFSALLAATARSAPEEKHSYNLPSGDAAVLLQEFSQISGKEVLYAAEVVRGVKTSAVQGDYTATEALDRMLIGTNLYELLDEKTGAISILRKAPVENATKAKETTSQSDLNREPVRDIVKLSVYEVSAKAYSGYVAAQTLSGSKAAMDIFDMPQTINIITRDLLDDMGAFDPGSAMSKTVPGVTSYFNPAPGLGLLIRGFNAQNWAVEGATTRLLGMVTNFNIEALEVVKGPTALLFGPFGAYGGYVNMVPKSAGLNTKNKLEATVGTDSYRSGMIDYGAALGESDNLFYRLVIGYLDNKRPGYPDDYNKGITIAPSLSIVMNPTTRLNVRLEANHMDQRWSRGAVDENNTFVPNFSSNGPIDNNKSVADNWTLQTTLTSQFNENWAFKFNFLYQTEELKFSKGFLNGGTPAKTYQYSLNKVDMVQNTFYGDFSTTWTLPDLGRGISNQFLAGINLNYYNNPWSFYALSQNYPEYAGIFIDPKNPDWDLVRSIELDYANLIFPYNRELLGGVIALNTFSLLDGKLKLLTGARYNYDERSNHIQRRSGRGASLVGTPSSVIANEKITLKYGAVYQLTDSLAAYYGHDEAYLPIGAVFRADGGKLDPETGKNDEIGLKLHLFKALGGSFSGSIAYFNLVVDNRYRADPDNPGFVLQDGVQENNGYDAQINYTSEKFSGMIGLYRGDGPVETSPPTGLKGVRAPQKTYNIWGKYNITSSLSFGGGYHYVGPTLSTSRVYKSDGFGAADLFVCYTTKLNQGLLNYRINVSNLTDSDAMIMYHIPAQVVTEDGRNLKVTVSYTW